MKVHEDIWAESSFVFLYGSVKHTERKYCSLIIEWLIKVLLSEKYNVKGRVCGMPFTLGQKKIKIVDCTSKIDSAHFAILPALRIIIWLNLC